MTLITNILEFRGLEEVTSKKDNNYFIGHFEDVNTYMLVRVNIFKMTDKIIIIFF